jgi:transposase-like protein
MPHPQRKFSKEYKMAAIEQVWAGKSVGDVAAACGVIDNTLYRWIRELGPGARKDDPQSAGIGADFTKNVAEARGRVRTQRKFTREFKKKVAQQIANEIPGAQVKSCPDTSLLIIIHAQM